MSFSLYHHPLSHCWKHCRQHLTRFVFAGISLSALSAALMLSAPTQAAPLRHNPMLSPTAGLTAIEWNWAITMAGI